MLMLLLLLLLLVKITVVVVADHMVSVAAIDASVTAAVALIGVYDVNDVVVITFVQRIP